MRESRNTMLNVFPNALGSALSQRFYDRPIFQVGASRSGAIVLYKALGTHPNVFSMSSEDLFVACVAAAVHPFEFGDQIGNLEGRARIRRICGAAMEKLGYAIPF